MLVILASDCDNSDGDDVSVLRAGNSDERILATEVAKKTPEDEQGNQTDEALFTVASAWHGVFQLRGFTRGI